MNRELPDIQVGLRKGRGTKRSNCEHLLDHRKSKGIPGKHLLLLYWLHESLCVYHNKLWKILKEMRIPDHLNCLLQNLYAHQEATVRTGYGKMDWFKIGKEVHQGSTLSPCLFNFYAEYIMWNAGLHKAQSGIKIAREMSITSDMQMKPPLWQKGKRN